MIDFFKFFLFFYLNEFSTKCFPFWWVGNFHVTFNVVLSVELIVKFQ